MSTILHTKNIWPTIKEAAKQSKFRCFAASAYFGAGASKLLPLREGDCLVVNAGINAVSSGQTCPHDLIKLLNKGVNVYDSQKLHAKVFVIGRKAFVGSANVSNNSASNLDEAVICTTESKVVQAARDFIRSKCTFALGPEALKELCKLYNPPKIPAVRRIKLGKRISDSEWSGPRVFISIVHREAWTDEEDSLYESALPMAKKKRNHIRGYELVGVPTNSRCMYLPGDRIIEVMEDDNGKKFMSCPGHFVFLKKKKRRRLEMYFYEHRTTIRKSIESVARRLGTSKKVLCQDGEIKDLKLVHRLMALWSE